MLNSLSEMNNIVFVVDGSHFRRRIVWCGRIENDMNGFYEKSDS